MSVRLLTVTDGQQRPPQAHSAHCTVPVHVHWTPLHSRTHRRNPSHACSRHHSSHIARGWTSTCKLLLQAMGVETVPIGVQQSDAVLLDSGAFTDAGSRYRDLNQDYAARALRL